MPVNPASDNAAAIELDGAYSWFRLGISMLISTVGSIGMWAIILVLPTVQNEFGVARADASIPYTATMLGFALGNLLIGRFADRFGIVAPLIVASLALGIGFSVAAVSQNNWQFSLIHALVGFGAAATFGPLIADISHWFIKRRGIAVAAAASGNYMAGAIWPLFLKDIIEIDGWREAYFLIGAICVLGMIPLTWFLRRKAPHQLPAGIAAQNVLPAPLPIRLTARQLQILLAFAGLGCCVAMSMPQVHIVAYCADLGYGLSAGAGMLSLMLTGGIISRLISGFIADYIGGIRTLLVSSILQCIALFLYLPFDGLVSLYIVSAIFGLSQGGIVPGYAIVVREYLPAHEAGQRVGMVIMATVIGMALGGWLSGFIFDLTQSYQAAFINGIVWNFFNIAIILFVLWRTLGMKRSLAQA